MFLTTATGTTPELQRSRTTILLRRRAFRGVVPAVHRPDDTERQRAQRRDRVVGGTGPRCVAVEGLSDQGHVRRRHPYSAQRRDQSRQQKTRLATRRAAGERQGHGRHHEEDHSRNDVVSDLHSSGDIETGATVGRKERPDADGEAGPWEQPSEVALGRFVRGGRRRRFRAISSSGD